MARTVALIFVLASMLAWQACGEEDAPQVDRPDVSSEVREIADETKEVQRDIAQAAEQVRADDQARAEAAEELEGLEARARELAQRAESELDDSEPARDGLREANETLADAASRLRRYAEDADDPALLEDAEQALGEAQDDLDNVADDLRERLGEGADDLIEELEREVPGAIGGDGR